MAVEGIILAAGMSSRAGVFKMTLSINGKTIIENTIDNMLKACSRITVVGGYNIDRLRPIIEQYSVVELVYNENYHHGMFSSVIKGISCIKEERFFLVPGDYPLIDFRVYRELLKYEKEDIVIPVFEGKKGHPVLFSRNIAKELMNNVHYDNLRDFIRSRKAFLVPVDFREILMDIDTIEDYHRILEIAAKRG
jgi:molybdenum cofactor cytidylyltransferase